jgi:hypothetical protein
MRGSKGFRDAVVDPEADETTKLPPKLVYADKSTSNGRRSELRDVDRHNHTASTNTHTSQYSTGVNQCKTSVMICTKHHAGAQAKDQGLDVERLLAADIVVGDICKERPEKGTSLIDGDDIRLDICKMRG